LILNNPTQSNLVWESAEALICGADAAEASGDFPSARARRQAAVEFWQPLADKNPQHSWFTRVLKSARSATTRPMPSSSPSQ
jgi:hypothetical protein